MLKGISSEIMLTIIKKNSTDENDGNHSERSWQVDQLVRNNDQGLDKETRIINDLVTFV